ncbi:TPA: hypothetical protein ACPZB8_004156 [Yersinia enterocolitica]
MASVILFVCQRGAAKEEERVTIVSYSDVQSLNDLQCFVTLPGDYPVVKLSMKYQEMPKVADALLLRDVHTSLDRSIEDELVRRTEEERRSLDGLFTPAPIASDVEHAVSENPPQKPTSPPGNLASTTVPAGTTVAQAASTVATVNGGGGTERDIEQDLQDAMPPGVSSDGEVIDYGAYEAWQQSQHQTRDMTRREEVNINHATDREHELDGGREY